MDLEPLPLAPLYLISLCFCQREIGTNQVPFQGGKPPYLIAKTSITTLWDAMHQIQCTFHINPQYFLLFTKKQKHDTLIMNTGLLANFTINKQISINQWRIYLKILYLSDVCTRQNITFHKLIRAKLPINSTYNFPNTPKPRVSAWNIWHQYLSKIIWTHTNTTSLPYLGPWQSVPLHKNGSIIILQTITSIRYEATI